MQFEVAQRSAPVICSKPHVWHTYRKHFPGLSIFVVQTSKHLHTYKHIYICKMPTRNLASVLSQILNTLLPKVFFLFFFLIILYCEYFPCHFQIFALISGADFCFFCANNSLIWLPLTWVPPKILRWRKILLCVFWRHRDACVYKMQEYTYFFLWLFC